MAIGYVLGVLLHWLIACPYILMRPRYKLGGFVFDLIGSLIWYRLALLNALLSFGVAFALFDYSPMSYLFPLSFILG